MCGVPASLPQPGRNQTKGWVGEEMGSRRLVRDRLGPSDPPDVKRKVGAEAPRWASWILEACRRRSLHQAPATGSSVVCSGCRVPVWGSGRKSASFLLLLLLGRP